MTDDEQKQLHEAYPKLWEKTDGPWVGSGWYDLLTALSWCLKQTDPKCQAVQVKEKFGALRFYTRDGVSSAGGKAIEYAEKLSLCTCEECGERGECREKQHWFKVLCGGCAERLGFS